MEINSYHSLLRNKNKCSHLGIPKNEKKKKDYVKQTDAPFLHITCESKSVCENS